MGDLIRYLRALPAAQIRLMIWSGLLLGLLLFQAMSLWSPPQSGTGAPAAAAVDPYAEARRSRAILEAQEGAPAPVEVTASRGDSAVVAGAVRVIDGDTFEVGGIRVRIADIDTPEVH
jgi:anti-sigma factor RsiW